MNDERTMSHDEALDLAAGYVLGALEPAEEAAVREHLLTCSEPHLEFAELAGVVPYLVEDLELVEPPAGLGARIMAAAAADLAARSTAPSAEPGAPAAETDAGTRPPTTPFPTAAGREERAVRAERTRAEQNRPIDWALRIAAVLAIVAFGAWNLQLQSQVTDLRQQVGAAQSFETAVAAVLDVAARPGSQSALLSPQQPGGPRGIAAVASDGSIQLALQDLAPTTGTQVYETWAIVGDAAPVPLGSFTVGPAGTAAFTSRPGPVAPGVVVALSREPQAGATAPTEVVSVGVSTAPAT